MDITLTYGVLPTKEQFEEQYVKTLGSDCNIYKVRNCKTVGNQDYTITALWGTINLFYNRAERDIRIDSIKANEYSDWISCVLETLGIEWI